MSTAPPEEEFIDTVDEIVAHLRKDPILVQEAMGNGYTTELTEALHDLEAKANYPVYVVYAVTPQGISRGSGDEELASLIHAAIGKDGVYVVHTSKGGSHVGVWGDFDPTEDTDEMLLSLARSSVEDQIEGVTQTQGKVEFVMAPHAKAAAALEVAAIDGIPDYREPILTPEQLEAYSHPMWSFMGYTSRLDREDAEPATPGYSAMTGTLVAVLVLVCGYRLLQAIGARNLAPSPAQSGSSKSGSSKFGSARSSTAAGKGRGTPPAELTKAEHAERQLSLVRTKASNELTRLERSLTKPGERRRAGEERTELATRSLEAGTDLLDSTDLLDVVGALVLARTGARAMSKDGTEIYRCCYVNPLHGEATRLQTVAGGISVGVCSKCERDLATGRVLDSLVEVRRLALDKPYYSGNSVWAETGYGALVDDLWRHASQRRS